ncbi:thiolase family protein [[Mycobacterium] vasticus]|uniref:acetyl-CoA C-acyltransferase n=1 Tax=[Mycobacterium] vasticus TaxID=2875777 RepID=A0ABU5YYQ1_9MYCO|nr:thiolase family protein [Mycolicibacter sp. MYC017]MEB3070269.1 thiolase family protein [Mycolicibacter sp. MYC017]
MEKAVIVSAARTPIATARKGALAETPAYELAQAILGACVERATVDPALVEDVIFAESEWGGGDLARYAAVAAGLTGAGGQAVNRHCAGSLAAVGNAAASVRAGMDRIVVAGGVQSTSTAPIMTWRVPGTVDDYIEGWHPPGHPDRPDAPNRDMTITVGWNTAQEAGISREMMDTWSLRSHQRAVAAIDAGRFADEIVTVDARQRDGSTVPFAIDEHPRRESSYEKLAALKPLHPEIPGFSITAGNSSGVNDAASALMIAASSAVRDHGLTPLATVRSWAAVGVDPARTGLSVLDAIPKALDRAGINIDDVALWEINEAFASVPIAAVHKFDLDEDNVNIYGSGCSLGHPVAATGTRMLSTLIYELRRRNGGIGVATMCAGGGQGGAVVIEVA